MKNFLALLAAFVMLVGGSRAAAAFSTVEPMSRDGGEGIADPDDQMPGFMTAPDNAQGAMQSLTSPADRVTLPSMGEYDQGAAAFNQAYARQQSR